MTTEHDANAYREAGYAVFGLHGVTNGVCSCGDIECKALYKHPISSSWQYSPVFSDEQFDFGVEVGQFDTGFGVLCKGLIVIDVDARNGGVESLKKLITDIPEIAECDFIINTGSGNGSRHYYFKAPDGISLSQHLKQYQGIDFKSSGYVVGSGSMHNSGKRYEIAYGSINNISEAPQGLIDLLSISEKHRTVYNGYTIDISDMQLSELINAINPDCEYEQWIRCGMAIHEATGGAGFDIWDSWSAKGKKYASEDELNVHWHSFGKSANPVTIGTLIHYAEENGYSFVEDVEFESNIDWGTSATDEPIQCNTIDLLRPPGFVGRITKWINSQSKYPREHLAVAAALMTVSAVAGMRYRDDTDDTVANMFCFGVAGSATGKEAIIKAHTRLLRGAGITPAVHGAFKSEKEVYQNLIRHQAAFYTIDEMGETLGKITNARKKGTAAYLEGLIGTLMNIYSKSDSYALIGGDMKEDIKRSVIQEMVALKRKIDENEANDKDKNMYDRLESTLNSVDNGLENPYLNIFGLTTPERFNSLMDFDMASSGFIGRSVIFKESDDNPRRNKHIKSDEEEYQKIANQLSQMYHNGHSESPMGRIERIGEIEKIKTTKKGIELLDEVEDFFMDLAEFHKEKTGLTALPRRGRELVNKISLILAIPEGVRNEEHITWAFALIRRDIENKINITNANNTHDKSDSLISRILSHIDDTEGITAGVLKNKCRPEKAENIQKVIELLIDNGKIKAIEIKPIRGKPSIKYFKNF